ncbi:hypothetical protein MUCCIDRAFT_110931 [Mucor lusitanicus CBS 277.49]|uniref:Uncharacterized protein n=1 Tax=Mucor lusitanicus CBS 277.49 TaxID=747725 RepID=A0A162TEX8_MUCCL|nr:hypothetical protein MUCCIDRAFT_110931 [Mucor lusitanicus CBS 277.49]
MNHHHHRARFTVCSPPPPPLNQHGISTVRLHAVHYSIPPPHHSYYHSAPPHVHSHYYRPAQWYPSTYASSRRSSSLSSQPTHRKRKKSVITSPAHENRLQQQQQEPFSVIRSFKSTVRWISKTFCFCYSDDIIEFNDHYYKKEEKPSG